MRIYISGPITSDPRYEEHFQLAAWHIMARGDEYVNPAKLASVIPNAEWDTYMALDYQLLKRCGAIVQLPGWRESRGCQTELNWAKHLGLKIMTLEEIKHEPV